MADKAFSKQVSNETVEPYREVMIFRTLVEGDIVCDGQSFKNAPPQTFYAIVTKQGMPDAFADDYKSDGERLLVGRDVEAVRAQIDRYAPRGGAPVPQVNSESEGEAGDNTTTAA